MPPQNFNNLINKKNTELYLCETITCHVFSLAFHQVQTVQQYQQVLSYYDIDKSRRWLRSRVGAVATIL